MATPALYTAVQKPAASSSAEVKLAPLLPLLREKFPEPPLPLSPPLGGRPKLDEGRRSQRGAATECSAAVSGPRSVSQWARLQAPVVSPSYQMSHVYKEVCCCRLAHCELLAAGFMQHERGGGAHHRAASLMHRRCSSLHVAPRRQRSAASSSARICGQGVQILTSVYVPTPFELLVALLDRAVADVQPDGMVCEDVTGFPVT